MGTGGEHAEPSRPIAFAGDYPGCIPDGAIAQTRLAIALAIAGAGGPWTKMNRSLSQIFEIAPT